MNNAVWQTFFPSLALLYSMYSSFYCCWFQFFLGKFIFIDFCCKFHEFQARSSEWSDSFADVSSDLSIIESSSSRSSEAETETGSESSWEGEFNRLPNKMTTFRRQLRYLLWKNVLIKKRQKVRFFPWKGLTRMDYLKIYWLTHYYRWIFPAKFTTSFTFQYNSSLNMLLNV